MTAAKMIHVTTGNEMIFTGHEWSTGRITRRRVSGDDTRRSRVIGAPMTSSGAATRVSSRCCTMCTEKSVVSYVAMGDASAMSSTNRPAIHDQ